MDFQQILITRCQIDLGKPLLAAVSGGPDSLCLADLLNQLHIAVVIAHFDHQLRPSSATEVEMIRSYAERNHNEFTSGSMDVKHFAESQKLSIEEAARKARYTFLFEEAKKYKAQAVVTGHTADDQVETILMHLLRGSGAEGLQGMAFFSSGKVWDSMIPLARPLLNTWRSETIAYCREHQLEPVTDETNSETKYYRNRIRLELIPLLETYNPRFKENLLKTADVIRELIGRLGENITIRRVARYTSDSTRVVANYVHAGDIEGHYGPMEGRLGVLVELGVSDVAAAGSNAFRDLAHDLTLQIAANHPRYLSPEDIPDDLVQQERETLIAQLTKENKPEHIKAKIVQGRLDKLAQEICLLKQAFAKDENVSIEELLEQKSKAIGASVTINRFARFEVGD